jgi:hypothetical protein
MEANELSKLESIRKDVEDFEKSIAIPEVEEPLYDNRSTMSVAEFSKINKPLRVGLRYLHRAWSASVDGYGEEARRMQELGRKEIEEARRLLDEFLKSKTL